MNFERLQEHMNLNRVQNSTLRNVAISNEPSTIELTFDPLFAACGTVDVDFRKHLEKGGRKLQTIKVEAVTIDQDIRTHDLPLPDFVKIDVEGLDMPVLKGMAQCLQDVHPKIYIEVHGKGRDAKEASLIEIIKFLTENGYNNFVNIEKDIDPDPLAGIGKSGVHYYCTRED